MLLSRFQFLDLRRFESACSLCECEENVWGGGDGREFDIA